MYAQKEPVELLIEAAEQHGQDSEPDHEVGDLQTYLRAAWKVLTPEQKLEVLQDDAVVDTFETAQFELEGPDLVRALKKSGVRP